MLWSLLQYNIIRKKMIKTNYVALNRSVVLYMNRRENPIAIVEERSPYTEPLDVKLSSLAKKLFEK